MQTVAHERAELCAEVMQSIKDYIEKHGVRGDALASAASDVCDGWVTRCEIQPLLDARRLKMVGRPAHEDAVCGDLGHYWTLALTKRELQRHWKDRLSH